jgi:hypothetical protein
MAALLVLPAATRRWLVALFAWHLLMEAVPWFLPSPIITNHYSPSVSTHHGLLMEIIKMQPGIAAI